MYNKKIIFNNFEYTDNNCKEFCYLNLINTVKKNNELDSDLELNDLKFNYNDDLKLFELNPKNINKIKNIFIIFGIDKVNYYLKDIKIFKNENIYINHYLTDKKFFINYLFKNSNGIEINLLIPISFGINDLYSNFNDNINDILENNTIKNYKIIDSLPKKHDFFYIKDKRNIILLFSSTTLF